MALDYARINFCLRDKFDLKNEEALLLSIIEISQSGKNAPIKGWCNRKRESLQKLVKCSKRSLIIYIKNLENLGLLEKETGSLLRCTNKYFDAKKVQKMHQQSADSAPIQEKEGAESAPMQEEKGADSAPIKCRKCTIEVQNLHQQSADSAPPYNIHEITLETTLKKHEREHEKNSHTQKKVSEQKKSKLSASEISKRKKLRQKRKSQMLIDDSNLEEEINLAKMDESWIRIKINFLKKFVGVEMDKAEFQEWIDKFYLMQAGNGKTWPRTSELRGNIVNWIKLELPKKQNNGRSKINSKFNSATKSERDANEHSSTKIGRVDADDLANWITS